MDNRAMIQGSLDYITEEYLTKTSKFTNPIRPWYNG